MYIHNGQCIFGSTLQARGVLGTSQNQALSPLAEFSMHCTAVGYSTKVHPLPQCIRFPLNLCWPGNVTSPQLEPEKPGRRRATLNWNMLEYVTPDANG